MANVSSNVLVSLRNAMDRAVHRTFFAVDRRATAGKPTRCQELTHEWVTTDDLG